MDSTIEEAPRQNELFVRDGLPPKHHVLPATGGSKVDDRLYIGGRYVKLSRSLSQTPWFVDRQRRKTSTSVEEIITEPIYRALQPLSITFMSAGREDVDVRCLGNGRPFALDIRGPAVRPESVDLAEVSAAINQNHSAEVRVHDLCFVDKSDLRTIKEGEGEKTKTYRALCWSARPVTEHELTSLLCRKEPLIISQTTPVRVLHRRTYTVRTRSIYWMKASFVADDRCNKPDSAQTGNEFYLDMCTQAGMYIKEFINGDFGRTTPSVMSILNAVEADCEALDVLEVDLVWPPKSKLPYMTTA